MSVLPLMRCYGVAIIVCREVITVTLGVSLPAEPTFRCPLLGDSLHIVTPCIFCVTDGGSV